MDDLSLDEPVHPAIGRALEAYTSAAYMMERAAGETENTAYIRRLYAAHLRKKGAKALAEVCGVAKR